MTGASFRSGAFQTAFARMEIPQRSAVSYGDSTSVTQWAHLRAGRITRLERMQVPAYVQARLAGAARLAEKQLDLLMPTCPAAVSVCVIANKQRVVTGFLPDRPGLADDMFPLASDMRSEITRRTDQAIGEVAETPVTKVVKVEPSLAPILSVGRRLGGQSARLHGSSRRSVPPLQLAAANRQIDPS